MPKPKSLSGREGLQSRRSGHGYRSHVTRRPSEHMCGGACIPLEIFDILGGAGVKGEPQPFRTSRHDFSNGEQVSGALVLGDAY